jgi:hypothetical protein
MFGLRAWPTPVSSTWITTQNKANSNQLAKPLWPFVVGSVLTWVGVAKLQAVALDSESLHGSKMEGRETDDVAPDARSNPKNPYSKLLNEWIHGS